MLLGNESRSFSYQENRRQRQRLLMGIGVSVLLVSVTLLMFVTNHHKMDRPHHPVELEAASSKVARAVAKAAKPGVAAVVGKGVAAAKPVPHEESAEQKIENVLKQNLDRTAKSLEQEQLRPLLISQGRAILHSAKASDTISQDLDQDGGHQDLHSALAHHQASDETLNHPGPHRADNVQGDESHKISGVSGVEDRTEQALRHQLDMETNMKEKKLFQSSLAKQHALVANFGPNSKAGGTDNNNNDNLNLSNDLKKKQKFSTKNSGVSESTVNEEAALRAQLEASTKKKQKKMYQHAFQEWLEKQQQVKYQKAKRQVKIAAREKQLFKTTLSKAKKEGPELEEKLKKKEFDEMAGNNDASKDHKPSFSTWLKAFKKQLAQRTKEASKKIAESRYLHQNDDDNTNNNNKGKKTAAAQQKAKEEEDKETENIKSPSQAIEDVAERRERAERAVKQLEKSLKLEEKEEKLVKNDEDSEHTPGKALALLKKTMKKEREALNEIAKDERGVGADPNLAKLAKKPKKQKAHNSGILGLDDLSYY